MKKLTYILAAALFFFSSCEKSPINIEGENDKGGTDIEVPVGGYIQFNTESITKGALINGGTLQHNFDVLGYKFASDWTTYKVQAKPTVFPRIVGTTEYDHVETISYANGYHSYPDPVEWTGDTYAFFAYYPCANGSTLTVSGADVEGTPYIDYTLDVANISNHIDVMTACVTKTTRQASKQGVNLTMNHRLAALDIVGYSYINAAAVNELNKGHQGWTPIPDDTPVEIVIDELTINFKDLKYNKARISLDEEEDLNKQTDAVESLIPSIVNEYNGNPSFTYISTEGGLSFRDGVTAFLSSKLPGGSVEAGCPMILIPQNDPITGSVDITYRIKVGDTMSNLTFTYTDLKFDIKNGLSKGVYSYVLFSFTKTGLFITVEESAQWEEINVEHQFE
ncbi:MAG: hypothetical protein E7121_04375 [Bacteroidales bacterium]|nr:hypothetical protein [Bacteroidales bacterium]